MPAKLITDRQKSADSILAVAETHKTAIADGVSRLSKPFLKKGEPVPDMAVLVHVCARALDAAKDRMVESDAANEAELADDPDVRTTRDDAASLLYTRLVDLREMLTGVYSADVAAKVFSGATPQDPVVLARFAGEVADRLSKVKLPAPRVKGAKLDTGDIVSSLAESRGDLEKQLKAVQREVREAQVTLSAKNAAVAAYDELFAGIAMTLAGLLRLAGQPELATKLRPSSRRPGQTADDAGDAPEPAAEPPTP